MAVNVPKQEDSMAEKQVVSTIPNLTRIMELRSLVVSIVSDETKEKAMQYMADITTALNRLKVDVDKMKKPYKDEIAKIDADVKPWKTSLEQKREEMGDAIIAYKQKVTAAIEKANQKSIAKFDTKVATKEAEAIAAGKPLPTIAPPNLKTLPPKTEKIEGAKFTTVVVKKWRVMIGGQPIANPDAMTAKTAEDAKLGIPLEYFVLDTVKVGKVVKAGGTIPGIDVYNDETLSVTVAKDEA